MGASLAALTSFTGHRTCKWAHLCAASRSRHTLCTPADPPLRKTHDRTDWAGRCRGSLSNPSFAARDDEVDIHVSEGARIWDPPREDSGKGPIRLTGVWLARSFSVPGKIHFPGARELLDFPRFRTLWIRGSHDAINRLAPVDRPSPFRANLSMGAGSGVVARMLNTRNLGELREVGLCAEYLDEGRPASEPCISRHRLLLEGSGVTNSMGIDYQQPRSKTPLFGRKQSTLSLLGRKPIFSVEAGLDFTIKVEHYHLLTMPGSACKSSGFHGNRLRHGPGASSIPAKPRSRKRWRHKRTV